MRLPEGVFYKNFLLEKRSDINNAENPEHDHYDVRFLLKVISDGHIVQNKESKELRWISKEYKDLPTQEPSVIRMFKKLLTL